MPLLQKDLAHYLQGINSAASSAIAAGASMANATEHEKGEAKRAAEQQALLKYMQAQKSGSVNEQGQFTPGTEQLGKERAAQRHEEQAQRLFDANRGGGGGSVSANDSGVTINAKEFNPALEEYKKAAQRHKEVVDLYKEAHKAFSKEDESVDSMRVMDAFLQNPNSKNLADLKARSVQIQGLPARAFGAEMKNSSFDTAGFSNVMQKINNWTGDQGSNPLTAADLNTFRENYKVMRQGAVNKLDAAHKDFYETRAGELAPSMLEDGSLERQAAAHKAKLSEMYGGDYHKIPWEIPNNPGVPVPPTQAPLSNAPAQKAVSGLESLLGPLKSKIFGGAPTAPESGPHGPAVTQGGVTYKWNPQTKAYE